MTDNNGSRQSDSERVHEVDVVVVGAGLSGVYLLHKFREMGLRTRVIEAGSDVGGTWYWNRYPGARCDTESMFYIYSWPKDVLQEWSWSSRYPEQDEIQGYIRHVVDTFDLESDILFDTRVTDALFDEHRTRWTVKTDHGETISARFCVMATGCISKPNLPDIPSLERYAGERFHTARWPDEPVNFDGKRVGVIGTGSTGIQAIPMIAQKAARLTVFQRTAQFSIPAWNGPLDRAYEANVKANYDELWERCRTGSTGLHLDVRDRSVFDDPPDVREREFETAWAQGGFAFLFVYNDILTDLAANEEAAEFVRNKIRARVDDPEVAELLLPTTYPFATKRLCVDTDYYETYNRDNVRLVSLRRTPIDEVTETGIRVGNENIELDTLVFATGFDGMTGALFAINIRGRDNVALKDKWAEGPRTYLGLGSAGFPNLFTITGPGSPSVLSNMMTSIEQHVDWVTDCIGHLVAKGHESIEPTVEAEDAWVKHVDAVAHTTLFPLTDSWYTGANIEGKLRYFTPYVGGVGVYREKCDEVAAKGYEGFVLA